MLQLKEAAKKFKNWGIYRLAIELDMNQQCVYAWAWGKTSPSIANLLKICKVLECTPNDLLKY